MCKVRDGYKMTEIGEIPEEWQAVKLGHICTVKSSKRVYQSDYIESGIPFYRSKEIIELSKGVEPSIELYISEEMYSEYERKFGVPQKNDLFISSVGTIGKTWVSDGRKFYYKDGNITQVMANDKINTYYLSYLFETTVLKKQYMNQSSGSAQIALTIEKLNKLMIPLPPLFEQQKIADILSTVDQQIKQTDALIEKTKELKKGLMQRLLTKGIGHTEFKDTEIGRIPKEWEVKELNEVAEIILGQSPDSSTYNEVGDGIPFFQGKTEFGYLYPVVKKWCSRPKKIAEIDDILISVRAPVGDVNINNVKACIGRGLAAIRKTEKLNERYLFYFLKKNSAVFEKLSQGSTFTAINGDDLKCLKIPVPTIQEQERIAMILTKVDDEIIKLDSIVIKMQELKKALMQKLLTGKVRVKL